MRHGLAVLCLGAGLAMGQTNPEPVYTPTGILNYRPITGAGRGGWFVSSTIGLEGLAGGAISAGWGTIFNQPKEYGPHYEGFGKRFGIRMSTAAVANGVEASFGAMWGEDPRYIRAAGQPFKRRLGQVIKMSFMATNREGKTIPAYARFIAIPGSNFMSNTWRVDSEAKASDAGVRTLLGFLGRMSGNAFTEFWPDLRKKMSGH